jgi:hypothetical protein
MPNARTPKSTVKTRRRLPKEGAEILLRARVTRLGRNSWDTGDTITVRIPGHPVPVTIEANYLNELDAIE